MSPENTGDPSEPRDPSEQEQQLRASELPSHVDEGSTLEEPPTDPDRDGTAPVIQDEQNVVRAADVVDPAAVRRAPRFRSFVLAGVFSGLVLGLIIGLIVFREPQNRTFLVLMLMVDLALITTLTALIWAIVSERRSTGKRRGGRKTTA